ncbi:unnamed protein product [Ixodes persulcatus]
MRGRSRNHAVQAKSFRRLKASLPREAAELEFGDGGTLHNDVVGPRDGTVRRVMLLEDLGRLGVVGLAVRLRVPVHLELLGVREVDDIAAPHAFAFQAGCLQGGLFLVVDLENARCWISCRQTSTRNGGRFTLLRLPTTTCLKGIVRHIFACSENG